MIPHVRLGCSDCAAHASPVRPIRSRPRPGISTRKAGSRYNESRWRPRPPSRRLSACDRGARPQHNPPRLSKLLRVRNAPRRRLFSEIAPRASSRQPASLFGSSPAGDAAAPAPLRPPGRLRPCPCARSRAESAPAGARKAPKAPAGHSRCSRKMPCMTLQHGFGPG